MILNLNSETNLSGFYIVYNGSTNLEKKGWRGISHLLEHLVFKSVDHLLTDFDRDGLEYNAYTSSNNIVFYLTGLDRCVNKWKDTFLNLLLEFKITEEDFIKERLIVIEELSDCFNEQSQTHAMNLSRKLLNDFEPIGSRQDLEALTYADIKEFFELQYAKPSKIINVSKNSTYNNDSIEFSNITIDKKYELGNYDVELELSNEFKDKTSLIISSPLIEEDFGYVDFINSILGLGLASPLYTEVREKRGLVYYIQCYMSMLNKQGMSVISTVTSNENADKVLECVKEVINNPQKYITQERIDIVKDYFSVRSEINDIQRHQRVNKYISDTQTVFDILDEVNMDKIMEVYNKYYKFENFHVSNDKTEFTDDKN